jgi:hypothetical protein
MKPENYEKLLKLVANADETELAGIVEVIISRRKTLASAKKAETLSKLHVGCRVRLQGLKPKYLNGTHGIVLDIISPRKIKVELINPDPRGVNRFGHNPICAPELLEVIG